MSSGPSTSLSHRLGGPGDGKDGRLDIPVKVGRHLGIEEVQFGVGIALLLGEGRVEAPKGLDVIVLFVLEGLEELLQLRLGDLLGGQGVEPDPLFLYANGQFNGFQNAEVFNCHDLLLLIRGNCRFTALYSRISSTVNRRWAAGRLTARRGSR